MKYDFEKMILEKERIEDEIMKLEFEYEQYKKEFKRKIQYLNWDIYAIDEYLERISKKEAE